MVKMMRAKHFLNQINEGQVVAALARVERTTHARIRVFVSHRRHRDVLHAAQAEFARLGMDRTQGADGVLIYLAPRQQGLAVIGGKAIHERCGDEFWQQVTAEMAGHFRGAAYTSGVVHGIQRAGAMLAEHFPKAAQDGQAAGTPGEGERAGQAGAEAVGHD
jgi:uncharacterized membrane protein